MKKDEVEQQPLDLPGGGKAIIDWCRPLWMDGPDARRSLRLEVTVTLRGPVVLGAPEGPESLELENVQFQVMQAAAGRAKAEHAMTVTGPTERVYVFYMLPKAGLLKKQDTREALEAGLAKMEGKTSLAVRHAWFDDPAWSRLFGIFPGYDPPQWKSDRALMIHMAKAGDAIHGRRIVHHRVTFGERDQCRDFMRDIRKLKFKADGGPKEIAGGKFLALIERLEPTVATWHLHPVVLAVKELATANGGHYDGWETDLIPSRVPPPLMGPPPS